MFRVVALLLAAACLAEAGSLNPAASYERNMLARRRMALQRHGRRDNGASTLPILSTSLADRPYTSGSALLFHHKYLTPRAGCPFPQGGSGFNLVAQTVTPVGDVSSEQCECGRPRSN
jgi:hypothetical protein